jgi:hypothetical protein
MNPEKFTQADSNESIIEKAGKTAKKAVIMGAIAAAGLGGEVQAQDRGTEGAPAAGTNTVHVEKSAERSGDILSKESVAQFLEGVKKDGIEALSSSGAEKYSHLIKKISNFSVTVEQASSGALSVEQKKTLGSALVELHQTLKIVERNLPEVVEDMKTRRENLARSQASVHGGAYDLSEVDLKQAGEMVMAQKINEIKDAEKLAGKASALQERIAAAYHEITGEELK